MKHSKALALFLSVLCLSSFFLVGSHATETALSNFENTITSAKNLGYDFDENNFAKTKFAPSKARGMDDYPHFNVLILNASGQGQYYENWDFTKKIDTGITLSNATALFFSVSSYDISNLYEYNFKLLVGNHMYRVMDFQVGASVTTEEFQVFYSQAGKNPTDWQNYDFTFRPTSSYNSNFVMSFKNPKYGGSGNNFLLDFDDILIEWDTTENKLTGKISGFFGDLGDKITNWFNSLKEWIKAIPDTINKMIDNISNWFKEIGEKITSVVQDIKDWFSNLFTIPDGFGTEYKAKWQQFLKDRFGFLYEVVDIIGGIFSRISTGLNSDRHYMVFPEVKVPFFDKVLIEEQLFCYEDFISSNPTFNYIYQTYLIGVWGYFVFAFIKLSQKRYDRIMGVEE